MENKIPDSIRQIAFHRLQSIHADWMRKNSAGKDITIPDSVKREIALLEAIAYLDGVSGLHPTLESVQIINPINFTIPESENSPGNLIIKKRLHDKSADINTEIFMEFIQNKPKVIAELLKREEIK